MSDTQKHKKLNVPNLRFPGFEGEWENITIAECCTEFQSGKFINADAIADEGAYPVYGGNGLRGYAQSYNHDGDYTLIGRQGALCGNVRFVKGKTYITEHAIAVKASPENDTRFLAFLFDKMNLRQYSDQSAQPGLAVNKLLKLRIDIPRLEEQTKISKFLSCLDERISIQNKLIEDLRILKKAIMARLFQSSEGEMKTLGELTVNFSNRNKQRIPYPMFSVTNDKGFIPQSEQFENREMEGEDIAAYKLIHTGDIAYNPARINVGSIAQYNGKATCMISSLYVCIQAKKTVSDRWLMHILKSERLLYYYNLYAEGGVRLYLFYPNFSRIKVFAPPYAKQEIIADCLDAIEKKVEQESVLLNDLMKQKQFFLSRLFL